MSSQIETPNFSSGTYEDRQLVVNDLQEFLNQIIPYKTPTDMKMKIYSQAAYRISALSLDDYNIQDIISRSVVEESFFRKTVLVSEYVDDYNLSSEKSLPEAKPSNLEPLLKLIPQARAVLIRTYTRLANNFQLFETWEASVNPDRVTFGDVLLAGSLPELTEKDKKTIVEGFVFKWLSQGKQSIDLKEKYIGELQAELCVAAMVEKYGLQDRLSVVCQIALTNFGLQAKNSSRDDQFPRLKNLSDRVRSLSNRFEQKFPFPSGLPIRDFTQMYNWYASAAINKPERLRGVWNNINLTPEERMKLVIADLSQVLLDYPYDRNQILDQLTDYDNRKDYHQDDVFPVTNLESWNFATQTILTLFPEIGRETALRQLVNRVWNRRYDQELTQPTIPVSWRREICVFCRQYGMDDIADEIEKEGFDDKKIVATVESKKENRESEKRNQLRHAYRNLRIKPVTTKPN